MANEDPGVWDPGIRPRDLGSGVPDPRSQGPGVQTRVLNEDPRGLAQSDITFGPKMGSKKGPILSSD